MAQHGSLWRRDQRSQPCSAPLFSPSQSCSGGHRLALRCLELHLFPVLLFFLLSSSGTWEGCVISLPLTFADSGLPCPAFSLSVGTWARGEKMGACRTWPGAGQPAEGGQSCGRSWQGPSAEREPRRSVTQSWAYHGHGSLCSQPLRLHSTSHAPRSAKPRQLLDLTRAHWDR